MKETKRRTRLVEWHEVLGSNPSSFGKEKRPRI
jgi:hypothetical protein